MAMSANKYKNFANALVTWFRAESDLTDLTASSANNIYISSGTTKAVNPPCLTVEIMSSIPVFNDVDDGLYESIVLLTAHCASRADALVMIGQVEVMAAQDETTRVDASFSDAHIKTTAMRVIGPQDVLGIMAKEPNVRAVDTRLSIWWKEA